MYRTRLGAMNLSTALTFLLGLVVCYAAWLTSIVFCAAKALSLNNRFEMPGCIP
jgi:hypothetical protein